jgi:hypothetical protein
MSEFWKGMIVMGAMWTGWTIYQGPPNLHYPACRGVETDSIWDAPVIFDVSHWHDADDDGLPDALEDRAALEAEE